MSRTGARDTDDWRGVLRGLNSPLAHLAASQHAAEFLSARGHRRAAEAAYRELAQREPDNASALIGLSWLLELGGQRNEAKILRTRAEMVELERLGVPQEHRESALAFRLAANRAAPMPDRVPAAYVASLFDDYAEDFDGHLTETRYRGPEMVSQAMARALGAESGDWDVLDIGCGTGLAGSYLRPFARRLDGVDLSPKMLAKAQARAVYDRLDVGELADVLSNRPDSYDLVVAVDVLIYFGDLAPVFDAAAVALRAGGLFVFSSEVSLVPGIHLGGCRRFQHGLDYLRGLAAARPFVELLCEETSLRREQNQPVKSVIFVFGKGQGGQPGREIGLVVG